MTVLDVKGNQAWNSKGRVMLTLTRRVGEKILIGDDVVLTVLRVNGNQVRLGFIAPKEIEISREELYVTKQKDFTLRVKTKNILNKIFYKHNIF